MNRVAWYRYDDHLDEEQRYGTVVSVNEEDGLTTVHWDNGETSEVFTGYLESEAEVREHFA
jgi:hypothetical protein